MKNNKIIRCFDLFSGIGGFRQGIKQGLRSTDYKPEWISRCDIDPYANKLYDYCYNTKNELLLDNITDITGPLNPKKTNDPSNIEKIDIALPNFDLLTGGFPCQAFSSMGKRRGLREPRGTLFYAIELILRSKHPKNFILENVRGLLSIDNGETIKTMRMILEDIGYNVAIWLLNASDYGLPQTRRRVFIVGSKNISNLSDDHPPPKIKTFLSVTSYLKCLNPSSNPAISVL